MTDFDTLRNYIFNMVNKSRGKPMREHKKVGLIGRVSTEGQNEESQLDELIRWAELNNFKYKMYFEAESGDVPDRETIQKLEKDIKSGEIDGVVIINTDRLFRSSYLGAKFLHDYCETGKVTLYSIREGLNSDNPDALTFFQLFFSLAQKQLHQIREGANKGRAIIKKDPIKWKKKFKGGKPGRIVKLTQDKKDSIKRLFAVQCPVVQIARTCGLNRKTVDRYLLSENLREKRYLPVHAHNKVMVKSRGVSVV